MNRTILRTALTAALASVLLLACVDATNPGGSGPSLSGGDAGISFKIGTNEHGFTEFVTGAYTPAENSTCVVGSDAVGFTATKAIHIYFPGSTTGTFTDPPDTGTDLPKIGILIDFIYYEWEADKGCSFTIEVTGYGPVGGRIEGTFSGKLVDDTGTFIEVTDGVFSVVRYE